MSALPLPSPTQAQEAQPVQEEAKNFQVGQHIEYRPNAYSEKWYPGTILKLYPPTSAGKLQAEVRWDPHNYPNENYTPGVARNYEQAYNFSEIRVPVPPKPQKPEPVKPAPTAPVAPAAPTVPVAASAPDDPRIGTQVEAGPGGWHPATIQKVSESKQYFWVHYEDHAFADGWVAGYFIRPANTQQKLDDLATRGPRLGKYKIYVYTSGGFAAYNGDFELLSGGKYRVSLPGGKAGEGAYSFDKATTTVKWLSGPFASKDWDGSQKFTVEREGKTDKIRLKTNTLGTNSTD